MLVCGYVLKHKLLPGGTFDKREVAIGGRGSNFLITQIISLDP